MAQLATQLATLQGEVTSLHQENGTLTNANATLTTQVAGIVTAPTADSTVGPLELSGVLQGHQSGSLRHLPC